MIFCETSDPTEPPLDLGAEPMGEGGASVDGDWFITWSRSVGGKFNSNALGGLGETGRTGRKDFKLNESNVSCVEAEGSLRSNCGALLIFEGFVPQLNIFTVLEVRISGVFGTGSVWVVSAGGRLGDLSTRMGGS